MNGKPQRQLLSGLKDPVQDAQPGVEEVSSVLPGPSLVPWHGKSLHITSQTNPFCGAALWSPPLYLFKPLTEVRLSPFAPAEAYN